MEQPEKLRVAYLLPNLFTAASIFLGMLSLLASVKGEFAIAGWYIMLSLIFDGLDGRIARLTNTTSKFGVEFDSLADVVAFGVAPSVLFYFSVGHNYGRWGVLVAALFVIFGAVRLARFNVQVGTTEPNVFIGVPIPTAAVFVSSWIMLLEEFNALQVWGILMMFAMTVVAILMVSNVRFPSFKKISLDRANFIKILVILILIFSLLYLYPLPTLVTFMTGYILYGLLRATYYKFFGKRIHIQA